MDCCGKQRKQFVELARQQALRSTMMHRLGCVIVHDGVVIAAGFNHAFRHMAHSYSMHAEVAALFKAKKKHRWLLPDCSMYIVRIGRLGDLRLSKPCPDCHAEIEACGVRCTYYSVTT